MDKINQVSYWITNADFCLFLDNTVHSDKQPKLKIPKEIEPIAIF